MGLERLLPLDARAVLTDAKVPHLHFIGENSAWVNLGNVVSPTFGKLFVVPRAGMRVLQDNPVFCENLILEFLKR